MKNSKITRQDELQETLKDEFSIPAGKSTRRSGNISVSYNRVSSKDQMENGNSLIWQNERMDTFAVKNNYVLRGRYGGTFESAKTDERKEFKRMLADIKKDVTIANVLVYSYDRFSRSGTNGIFLLENLRKLGVRIIAITQEVDSFTPTGMFQENLYMLISKLDNDMRKDKCLAGTKSHLRNGYWPYAIPMGYDNLNKHSTADKRELIVNTQGQLLRQAFKWKADAKYSNQVIIEKLKAKGLNVSLRNMAWIFKNVFYCGYIRSSQLDNEIIKGKHPALIDIETFLKANNISRSNPRSGISKNHRIEALPLKVFAKDEISHSPLTGYHNKKKNLYYYKTRDKGTAVNISATHLNNRFVDYLKQFEFNKTFSLKLKATLYNGLEERLKDKLVNQQQNSKRITELTGTIEKLEERFVLGDITKEQYEKFKEKYEREKYVLSQELKNNEACSSNLEKAVKNGMKIAENISKIWHSSDFSMKQSLQYLVFPEGILFNKKKGTVRTIRINTIFSSIQLLAEVSEENKNGNPFKDCHLGSRVGTTRFELATPCTPYKCATGLRHVPNIFPKPVFVSDGKSSSKNQL